MAVAAKKAAARKGDDIVAKFHDAYHEALSDAEVSERHTDTEGWQSLYSQFRKEQQEKFRNVAASLRELADVVERVGTTEEDEKLIGDIKKACAELRGVREHFAATTVAPVKDPVDRCRDLINDYMRDAQIEEDGSPLHASGLTERMKEAVGSVRRAEWDADAGRVRIKPPRQVE